MDLLVALAGCLCQSIRDAGLPDPCFCGVMPGEQIAIDYVTGCDDQNGMAWTRLQLGYPASGVGVVNQQVRNCSGGFGVEIEMGVMRSAPIMQDDGEPPTAADQLLSTELQMGDMWAMVQAVNCCDALQNYDYIMSQYRPRGPAGFAVGGTFTVMVAL